MAESQEEIISPHLVHIGNANIHQQHWPKRRQPSLGPNLMEPGDSFKFWLIIVSFPPATHNRFSYFFL